MPTIHFYFYLGAYVLGLLTVDQRPRIYFYNLMTPHVCLMHLCRISYIIVALGVDISNIAKPHSHICIIEYDTSFMIHVLRIDLCHFAV